MERTVRPGQQLVFAAVERDVRMLPARRRQRLRTRPRSRMASARRDASSHSSGSLVGSMRPPAVRGPSPRSKCAVDVRDVDEMARDIVHGPRAASALALATGRRRSCGTARACRWARCVGDGTPATRDVTRGPARRRCDTGLSLSWRRQHRASPTVPIGCSAAMRSLRSLMPSACRGDGAGTQMLASTLVRRCVRGLQVKIGVLALQGAFATHAAVLRAARR